MSPDEAPLLPTPPPETPRPDAPDATVPRRPTPVWALLLGTVLILLGAQLAGVFLVLVSRVFSRDATGSSGHLLEGLMSPANVPWVYLTCALVATVMALLLARGDARGWRVRLGWVRPSMPWLDLLTVAIGTLALRYAFVVGVVGAWLAGFLPADLLKSDELRRTMAEGSPLTILLMVVAAAVVVPIEEESLFRGFLQRGLLEGRRPALALGITAAVFCSFHPPPWNALLVIPVALWQGWIAWRTRSILPAMLSHGIWNGIAFAGAVLQRLQHRTPSPDALRGVWHGHPYSQWAPWAGALTLAIVALAALRLHHVTRVAEPRDRAATPIT